MNYDNIIECSRCGSSLCYIKEIDEKNKLEYCMGCGFQSTNAYSTESMLQEQLNVLPEIYKVAMDREEDTRKVWIPTFVNVETGIVYLNGTGRDNYWWEAAPYSSENPGKFKREDIKQFPKEGGFMAALEYIGVI